MLSMTSTLPCLSLISFHDMCVHIIIHNNINFDFFENWRYQSAKFMNTGYPYGGDSWSQSHSQQYNYSITDTVLLSRSSQIIVPSKIVIWSILDKKIICTCPKTQIILFCQSNIDHVTLSIMSWKSTINLHF